MEIDLTQIIVTLIGLAGLIITSVVVPIMRTKLSKEQLDTISRYALAAVQAAEIIFHDGKGEEKLEWAIDYIEKQCALNHIKIDPVTIRVAIENAWKRLGLDAKK